MERPILFNTEMVRAILDGRKTVTRRLIKLTRKNIYKSACFNGKWNETYGDKIPENLIDWYVNKIAHSLYQIGDILWVRETWLKGDDEYHYKENASATSEEVRKEYGYKWRPSIHMPRESARIFLKVVDVRVEHLQDITEEQVKREGFLDYFEDNSIFYPSGYYFKKMWDSTIKKEGIDTYGWDANPWVWVIEFERISKEKVGN